MAADSTAPTERPKLGDEPQVDRDVEHLSFRRPNQLPLRVLDLIVQATQHATPRARMIVLHEVDVDAAVREGAPVPAFKEEPALVTEHFRYD